MKRISSIVISGLICWNVVAQDLPDSVILMDPYTIHGYLYNRPLSEAPAPVAIIADEDLERFGGVNLLPVVNTVPGVRMEERSPGSYRFSIRGSSIRSPFGVRNVKMYWNGLPFTDAGGNTYLNLLDLSSINRIEIVKGPGGSLYGAGTGGVVLLNSHPRPSSGVEISAMVGSFQMQKYQLRADLVGKKANAIFNYSRLQSDGYREQSRMTRDAAQLEVSYSVSTETTIKANLLVTDLFYQTPGGLTPEQFDENPRKSRPAAGAFKGAKEQNANVENATFYGGVGIDHEWSQRLKTNLALYVSKTNFDNFAIANLERRDETNTGVRSENTYSFEAGGSKGKVSAGGELQFMSSPINVNENNLGVSGPLMITDDLRSVQGLAFVQAEVDLPKQFFLTAGLSETWVRYQFERTYPEEQKIEKSFSPVLSPRIALLKKLNNISVFASASRGFSPPTLAEVRPSTNVFNAGLFAEKGINYEAGVRGKWSQFSFDMTGYWFSLRETIILERVENGAEYFINAGKTKQRGIETTLSWRPLKSVNTWGSVSYNHYRFSEYGDFTGNELTGVPPVTAVFGIDYNHTDGVYANVVYSYTDEIPLDDANMFFSDNYSLLSLRAGYRKQVGEKVAAEVFATIDNAFDERYSLGNDLNARGTRFFNAAPGRNFSVGIKFKIQ